MKNETPMKRCPKCKQDKPIDDFNKQTSQCRICKNKYLKKYHLKNIDKEKEYRLKNANEIRKTKKEYRLKNANEIKKAAKEYRSKNTEIIKEYRFINHDEINNQRRRYWFNNRNELKNIYIKKILVKFSKKIGLKHKEITPAMIEIKRDQLLLYRINNKIKRRILNGINSETT